jgi:hypothetical protein
MQIKPEKEKSLKFGIYKMLMPNNRCRYTRVQAIRNQAITRTLGFE